MDLREADEIAGSGTLAGSINIPYQDIEDTLTQDGTIDRWLNAGDKVLFICAYGERSSLALQKVDKQFIEQCYHLSDGVESLKQKSYQLATPRVSTTQSGTLAK